MGTCEGVVPGRMGGVRADCGIGAGGRVPEAIAVAGDSKGLTTARSPGSALGPATVGRDRGPPTKPGFAGGRSIGVTGGSLAAGIRVIGRTYGSGGRLMGADGGSPFPWNRAIRPPEGAGC